jgi:hypothetical protein
MYRYFLHVKDASGGFRMHEDGTLHIHFLTHIARAPDLRCLLTMPAARRDRHAGHVHRHRNCSYSEHSDPRADRGRGGVLALVSDIRGRLRGRAVQ